MAGAKRGPKKKSAKKNALQGNPGKRTRNTRPPEPPADEPVDIACPDWLCDEAKREWKRVAPALKKMGLLTAVDITALAGYCQAFARWKKAEQQIEAEGLTILNRFDQPIKNPAVEISEKAAKQVREWARDFGCTPASRGGIELPEPDEDDEVGGYEEEVEGQKKG